MAEITTSLTAIARPKAFTGFPDNMSNLTPIPKREIVFTVTDGAIAAAGALDNQALLVTCLLDVGYAYAFLEQSLSIRLDAAASNTWADDGTGFLTDANGGGANRTFLLPFGIHSNAPARSILNSLDEQQYKPTFVATQLMRGNGGDQASLKVAVKNGTNNAGAATCMFYARFLQYTIEQANHYAISMAQLVR